jgi:hypothetical protein
MKELRFTLLSDGPTDRALIPVLTWLLQAQNVECAIQPEWADLGRLRGYGRLSLAERIRWAVELYPCDLLFVHRDAEREPRENRVNEILGALNRTRRGQRLDNPVICVVPVRMQEAWLLFDSEAIRWASGNRTGRQPLSLPPIQSLEDVPDPKELLYELLRKASGLSGRRLERFDVSEQAIRVTSFVDDFSPLRVLPAFVALEQDIASLVREQDWVESVESDVTSASSLDLDLGQG